jgi:hypothetical protein
LITVDEDRYRTPENIDVICTIRKTANVIPSSRAANLPLSFTNSLYAIRSMPFMVVFLFWLPDLRFGVFQAG